MSTYNTNLTVLYRRPSEPAVAVARPQLVPDETGIEELAKRINTPVAADPLLVFEGDMTFEQVGAQLRALRDQARRKQSR